MTPFGDYAQLLKTSCLNQAVRGVVHDRDKLVRAIRRELDRIGEKPLYGKRKRGNTLPEMRYEWAALKQCSGKTIAEIADLYEEDSEVVRRATNRILDNLGFRNGGWSHLFTVLTPCGRWGQ